MLENIKLLLGINADDTSKDSLLMLLINNCESEATAYTHRNDIPSRLVESMVVCAYNRIGSEGLASESYNSTSYSYLADYPDPIRSQLRALRKVVTI